MNRPLLAPLLFLLLLRGCPAGSSPAREPPMAKQVARVDTVHGDIRVDNFLWHREKSDPEVVDYPNAENACTAAMMEPTRALQESLYAEFLSRTKQSDLSVPYYLGGFWYYTRTLEGRQYPIYWRKEGSLEGPEQVLPDGNILGAGRPFFSVGSMTVTDNGSLLAYTGDTTGFRVYECFFNDLTTGEILPDRPGPVRTVEWGAGDIAYTFLLTHLGITS